MHKGLSQHSGRMLALLGLLLTPTPLFADYQGDLAQGADLAALTEAAQSPTEVTWWQGHPDSLITDLDLSGAPSSSPVGLALYALTAYPDLFRIPDPGENLSVDRLIDHGLDQGVFFQQRFYGIPVYGAYVGINLHKSRLISMTGNYLTKAPGAAAPSLSALEAEAKALGKLPHSAMEIGGRAGLVWFNRQLNGENAGETRLAYQIGVRGVSAYSEEGTLFEVLVDAEDGSILQISDESHSAFEQDVETLNNTTSRICWRLWETANDQWFDTNGPTGYPGISQDAFSDGINTFDSAPLVHSYFVSRFGWEGWNGSGEGVHTRVHWGNASLPGQATNAAFSGACNHISFYDSTPVLDVFGHEYTHGIIRSSSKLKYRGESGALNESFADIFGQRLDPGDWTMAEESANLGTIRDLSDPPSRGQPDHMLASLSGDNRGLAPTVDMGRSNDNGNVHTNSGIPNKVAYLLIAGDSHNGLDIQSIGVAKAEQLFWEVMTSCLGSTARLQTAANASIAQARQWGLTGTFGFTSDDECQVRNAWSSVGLGDPDLDCDGLTDPDDLDDDQDGEPDTSDNCPTIFNPVQDDTDMDGSGDACDDDIDNDGEDNDTDNCPEVFNPSQTNSDLDPLGDACDLDRDGDGVDDVDDNCPDDYNPLQGDADSDGLGDACDDDADNDGRHNSHDNCPLVANAPWENVDGDSFGDACDNCPAVHNEDQLNMDGDAKGDACDEDIDNDGEDNGTDNCPYVFNPNQEDTNHNGIGYACDPMENSNMFVSREALAWMGWDPRLESAPGGRPLVRIPLDPCGPQCPGLDASPDWVMDISLELDDKHHVRVVDESGAIVSNAYGSDISLRLRPRSEMVFNTTADGSDPSEGGPAAYRLRSTLTLEIIGTESMEAGDTLPLQMGTRFGSDDWPLE